MISISDDIEKYGLLFNMANDAIFLHEMNAEGLPGRFIEVNNVACRRLGYEREQLLAMKAEDIADKESLILKQEIVQERFATGQATVELVYLCKDGTKLPVEVNSHIFYLKGQKVGLSIARDIRERKQNEKALQDQNELMQKLVDTVPIPIYYKDAQGIYTGCNAAFASLLGLTREEVIGKSVYDVSPQNRADVYREKDIELFKNPGAQVYESIIRSCDGKEHDVIFNRATFSDRDGNIAGLVGAIIDITEQKKMQQSIQNRIALEEAVAQASKLFVSPGGADLDEILKIIGQAVSTSRVVIFCLREKQTKIDCVHEWCQTGFKSNIGFLQGLSVNAITWWMGLCSTLAFPINSSDGTIMGYIAFDDMEKSRAWSAEDNNVLRVIAEMVGGYWERKRAEEELCKSNQLLQQIIEFLPDATMVIDREKKVLAWNRAIEEMTGVNKEDIVGKGDYAYAVPFYGISRPILIDYIFTEKNQRDMPYPYIKSKGDALYTESFTPALFGGKGAYLWGLASQLYDGDGKLIGAIESVRDVTERKLMEEKLQYLATHDALTNIPNRYFLEDTLKRVAAKAKHDEKSALLFIDLDNFKLVNDTLGHAVGDELLVALVNIFKKTLRKDDLLARLGGDEFAVLLEGVTDQEAKEAAEKLRQAVCDNEINLFTYTRLNLSISIGIIMVDGTLDYPRYLSLADTALYTAKENGRNRSAFMESADDPINKLTETNRLVGLIKNALQENRFVLHFQPVFNLKEEKIIHYEALTRLCDTQGDLICPGKFIPVAERFGLMPQIDRWVVKNSLDIMRRHPELRLFINLSGITLGDEVILAEIEASIRESGIEPSRIGFEITETSALKDIFRTARWINRFKGLGCRFALDDFGTGFSSLYYLQILPVDYIKIDGSFVKNVDKEPVHRALLQAINTIANTLGKKTVAEFVENGDILNVLQTIGIECGQGSYLGRPEVYPRLSAAK